MLLCIAVDLPSSGFDAAADPERVCASSLCCIDIELLEESSGGRNNRKIFSCHRRCDVHTFCTRGLLGNPLAASPHFFCLGPLFWAGTSACDELDVGVVISVETLAPPCSACK